MKRKNYKSEILMVIHQDMEAIYELGGITVEEMREFDEGCLVPEAIPVRGAAGGSEAPVSFAASQKRRPASGRKKAVAAKTTVVTPKNAVYARSKA